MRSRDKVARAPQASTSQRTNLIGDAIAREQAGLNGKAYVDSEFSEASLLARWDTMFESLGLPISNPLDAM